VTARIPVRSNRDNRYFTDTYQAMPSLGFTKMFDRMLDHPNIKVMTNTDYKEIEESIVYKKMIYTGPVDYYFDNCYGKLPYRSIEFEFRTYEMATFQQTGTINFPNEHPYTRVTEFKYLSGQNHPKTSVVYEYPKAEGDPYYPVPRPENAELYKKYQLLTKDLKDVFFTGRLATYKYYNMDQVVAQSLALYKRIMAQEKELSTQNNHSVSVLQTGIATIDNA
jgi:UDP-galactopyranose mutase